MKLTDLVRRFPLLLALGLGSFACDPGEEDDNQPRGGSEDEANAATGTLVLTSTSLDSTSLLLLEDGDDEAESCQSQIDVQSLSGVCLTPTLVTGRAHFIDAASGSLSATIDDQARIMRAGAEGTSESEGQIVLGADFSLNDTKSVNGENELARAYERKPTYDLISFETYSLKIQFKAKDKYVTMLIVTHPQPFNESDFATQGDCAVPADERSRSRYTEADIFSGMTFERGDYLFCVKDTAAALCGSDDYQWYDMDSEELVAMSDDRPSNPRTNAWLLFDSPTCQSNDYGSLDFSMSGLKFIAELSSSFQLYADYSHGVNSVQWPDGVEPFGEAPSEDSEGDDFEDPYVIYYYKASDSSETIEGNTLKVTLDFDVEDMLFVNMTESDYEDATLLEVLKVVDTKTNIGFNSKGTAQQVGYNATEMTGLEVSATVEVSGGTGRPD